MPVLVSRQSAAQGASVPQVLAQRSQADQAVAEAAAAVARLSWFTKVRLQMWISLMCSLLRERQARPMVHKDLVALEQTVAAENLATS